MGQLAGEGPKHRQLQLALAELVASELSPGERLPSERQLLARFGVSRATVRHAIAALERDGVVERRHGSGTYVAERRVTSRLHLASFSEDMARRGLTPVTRLLTAARIAADAEVSTALDVSPGEEVARIERLRCADGRPMAYEVGSYPLGRLPGLLEADLTGSVYELLRRRYRRPPDGGQQLLWAEPAAAWLAGWLEVEEGAPLLVFQRTALSRGEAIEHTTSWYRADRYRISMELGPH